MLDGAASVCVQAAGRLAAHASGSARPRFSLWLQHETRGRHALPPTRLRIELGQPSRDAAQLGLLLRERLSRCTLPAPVYALQLRLDEAVALSGHAAALAFGSDRGGARWHDAGQEQQNFLALLDRLSARLGRRTCSAGRSMPTTGPSRRRAPRPPPTRRHAAVGGSTAAAPELAAARAAAPGRAAGPAAARRPAAAAARRARAHRGRLVRRRAVCRDYHVAVGPDHRLRWVFRERGLDGAGWFLHGLFG